MTRQPHILVVDDEAHIVHVVSLKLRNAGYAVTTAADGEEALALALRETFDLIITDYQMPFLTGLDLCVQLKEHEQTAHLPVILLTAHGFSLGADQFDQTNIVEVISKPFSPREVLIRVQELVSDPKTQGEAA